jgi:hypothetical protein
VERRQAPAQSSADLRFLLAEAGELIDSQYRDRPGLRPVLDAVLAALPVLEALPALGPVTVQARKTLVSLVTPRRTFAVIQATTKTRVDLGLRLADQQPAGRLLAARDLGAATLRIALTAPRDVDSEVLDWLRRAYQENSAVPTAASRPPARHQATEIGTLAVAIEASSLPGLSCPSADGGEHHNIHVALCMKKTSKTALIVPGKPWVAIEAVPGNAPSARWEAAVTVRRDADGLDFSGPYVRGDRTDRNLFVVWGPVPGDGTLRLVAGSKLALGAIDPRLIEGALRRGHHLVARAKLTRTGTLKGPAITWSAEPADVNTRTS